MKPPPRQSNKKRWVLTVVVPLALHQLIYLKVSLWSWAKLFPPCFENSTLAPSVNLLFYSNVPLSLNVSAAILEMCEPFRQCFGRISFVDAKIKPERDVYGEGTVDMFYNLWGPERHVFLDPKETNVIYLMEPDTRPVRANWLEKVYWESKLPDFWIRGSAPQYPVWPSDSPLGEPMHINGNALYRSFHAMSISPI